MSVSQGSPLAAVVNNNMIKPKGGKAEQMKYYRVHDYCDQVAKVKIVNGSGYRFKIDGILVANELYTPAERAKLLNSDKCFEVVEISKTKTYWFFGARFAD